MAISNDDLLLRITAIEQFLTKLQTAINNAANKTQLIQFTSIRQAEVLALRREVDEIRASIPVGGSSGGGGGGILDVQHFQAESLDDADANWTNMVTTSAPLADSPSTASIYTRSYSGSTSNATGGKFRAPTGATNLKFEWIQQAASAPGTTNNKVQWRLSFRALGSTSSPTNYDFTTQTIANNTTLAIFNETVSLATLGLTAGNIYQFQLVRVISGVTNNMTQACQLSEWITTWT